jgi:hypothetical protein
MYIYISMWLYIFCWFNKYQYFCIKISNKVLIINNRMKKKDNLWYMYTFLFWKLVMIYNVGYLYFMTKICYVIL